MAFFHLRRFADFMSFMLLRPNRWVKHVKNSNLSEFVNNVVELPANGGFNQIVKIRNEYLSNKQQIEVKDFGAGSRKSNSNIRRISDIASISGSGEKKCLLLHNIAAYYKPAVIVELGTSLGLSAMSLSLGSPHSVVYTIEGSSGLYSEASVQFKKHHFINIKPVCGNFDEVLPALLKELTVVDLFFIDGNHTYEATMRYFNLIQEFSKPSTIMVFDDIRWSEGMFAAWQDICGSSRTKIAFDLFNLGVVIMPEIINKQYFRIYY